MENCDSTVETVQDDEDVKVQVKPDGSTQVSIEKNKQNLTPLEIRQHWSEILKSIQKELLVWAHNGCISRKPRNQAKNIVDCKFVITWTWELNTVSATESTKQKQDGRWTIRCRLTIRGFKDQDKDYLDTYAGTAQRYAQRITCAITPQMGWDICIADISKAFLKGVTYTELAKITGEPLREVNFYLPQYCTPLIRQVPGFEHFDPIREVIHCDKPGTGSVDAPRCFSLKLKQVTDKIGMKSCTIDPELCIMHKQRSSASSSNQRNNLDTLVALMTKHVDDLKICGTKDAVTWILG